MLESWTRNVASYRLECTTSFNRGHECTEYLGI